jgi:hypothetical protein
LRHYRELNRAIREISALIRESALVRLSGHFPPVDKIRSSDRSPKVSEKVLASPNPIARFETRPCPCERRAGLGDGGESPSRCPDAPRSLVARGPRVRLLLPPPENLLPRGEAGMNTSRSAGGSAKGSAAPMAVGRPRASGTTSRLPLRRNKGKSGPFVSGSRPWMKNNVIGTTYGGRRESRCLVPGTASLPRRSEEDYFGRR